jgi:hypothetical protein
MTPQRPTPDELFDMVDDAAAADEANRILTMSKEDLDRELVEAHVDPEQLRAKGRALAEAMAPPKAAPVVRLRRSRWVVLLAAALSPAAVAAWIMTMTSGPVLMPGAGSPPTPAERAAELRTNAHAECARQAWRACLEHLDRARDIDPEVDETARRDRELAERALQRR